MATLSGIGLLAAALVLVFAVLPASAGPGANSGSGIVPFEIDFGGGSGACSYEYPGRLPSDAAYELHINNPASGPYTGPDGTIVEITVDSKDEYFDFVFVNNPTMAAFDVVVNGGSQNTHFDYDGNGGDGPARQDTDLHAPTKGGSGNLYRLSHINICYDTNPIADLSVDKKPLDGSGNPITADDFFVNEEDLVTYRIRVSNAAIPVSNTTATGVTVTDTIPDGMSFIDAPDVNGTTIIGTPGTDADGKATYTWTGTGLNLAQGTSIDLTLILKVDEATGGSDLSNKVKVAGDQTDPTTGPDNEDTAVPAVTVNAKISGFVFKDNNANSLFDSGDVPEALDVTVYSSGVAVGLPVLSDATTGAYSFDLEPGLTYIVCLEERSGFQQTVPDLATETGSPVVEGVPCPPGHEPAGYEIPLTVNSSGNDFGNLPRLDCGITRTVTATGVFTSASVIIFTNSVLTCGEKGYELFIDNENVPPEVGILLDGTGSAAGRADIVKNFSDAGDPSPATFAALQYSPDGILAFEEVVWCNDRPAADAFEEGQFEDSVLPAGRYPSLLDDFGDPLQDGFGNAIVCKVAEFEDITGAQKTVVYFETLDPYFR